jgi:predicted PurR-regulated permease PerM
MQESRQATPWKQTTLFLLTLGVLILCALLLQPFFSAIVGAIVLAVVTRYPYDRLAAKIKNRSLCATIALLVIILAVIIPTFFLAQELGKQTYTTVPNLPLASKPSRARSTSTTPRAAPPPTSEETSPAFSATPSASSPSSSSCSFSCSFSSATATSR